MPNWCTSNMAVKGHSDELNRFADIVNSLHSAALADRSDFGPFWLGNLVDRLGGDWNRIPCRGILDPDSEACACMCCPEPEPTSRIAVENGVLRFSLTMAWDLDLGLLDFFKSKFRSFEFYWKSTDEFGNFYRRHDPDCLIDDAVYVLDDGENSKSYTREERDEFLKDLKELTGLDVEGVTDDDLYDGNFAKDFHAWRESVPEGDGRRWSGYVVWTDA